MRRVNKKKPGCFRLLASLASLSMLKVVELHEGNQKEKRTMVSSFAGSILHFLVNIQLR
jgi:hypothetical protein